MMDIRKPVWEQGDFDPEAFLYQYRAVVMSAYDADTIRVLLDQGMGTWKIGKVKDGLPLGIPVRLARVNSWEVRGPEREKGLAAREFVRNLLPPKSEIRLFTYKDKDGKYGRLLADVALRDGDGRRYCLNDLLVQMGHAQYRNYGDLD